MHPDRRHAALHADAVEAAQDDRYREVFERDRRAAVARVSDQSALAVELYVRSDLSAEDLVLIFCAAPAMLTVPETLALSARIVTAGGELPQ